MRKIVFVLGLLFLFSCEDKEQIDRKILDGDYSGTFQRELDWNESDIANITMTFSSNKWTGTSDILKYPALCTGTYSIVGDTIVFQDECIWTAEFDWSLILGGKYLLKQTENTLEFTRDYRSATADTYVDRYKITKEQ